MQNKSLNGITLYFELEDQATVDLVHQACEKSVKLIYDHYGLDTPNDCRVFIMTSWLGFIFYSAPWPWKVLLGATLPLWAFRIRKIWPLVGGWEQRYGQRRAIGVKPPRLLLLADRRIGDRFFIRRENAELEVQSITCHELTHAFTSHLQLPTWLKEGLAMLMVDKYFEEPTVRYDTLDIFELPPDIHKLARNRKLSVEDEDALVELYASGYWLTRYIDETKPGLLKVILSRQYTYDDLEDKIAASYGKEISKFWHEIYDAVAAHFKKYEHL